MKDDAASSAVIAVDVTREDAESPVLAERSGENEQEQDEGSEIEEEVGKAGLCFAVEPWPPCETAVGSPKESSIVAECLSSTLDFPGDL